MTTVTHFLGLDRFDWSNYHIVSNSKSTDLHESADNLPINPAVVQRMRDFYARFNHTYYDMVRQHGYYGCRPDIVKSE